MLSDGIFKTTLIHFIRCSAMVLGFNVSAPRSIEANASSAKVPIHVDTVIYRLMDEVKSRLAAMLPPVVEKRVVGEAKIQQIFELNRKGADNLVIAGCRVVNGILEKHKMARVVRDGQTVAEGPFPCFAQKVR